jgi:hypothetical protein
VVRLQVESLIPYDLCIFYNPVDAMRWLTHNKGHPRLSEREREHCRCVNYLFVLLVDSVNCSVSIIIPYDQCHSNPGAVVPVLIFVWKQYVYVQAVTLLLVGDRTSFHVLSIP